MSTETEVTGPGDATVAGPTQATARLAPRRRGSWLAFVGPPFLVFLAVVGLWYGVSYLMLDVDRRFLQPPPHAVFQVALLDPYNLAELLDGLWLSTRVAFLGFAVAIVVGTALAVAMSQARSSGRCTLHGANRLTRLWKLQFPAALPAVFAGLRIVARLAVIGAIVGDFFFRQGSPGIGILIDRYQSRLQSEQMVAAILLSSLLGILVFWFFGLLAKRVVGSWHESAGGPGS